MMLQRLKNGCWQATSNLNLKNKRHAKVCRLFFAFSISQNLKLFLLAPQMAAVKPVNIRYRLFIIRPQIDFQIGKPYQHQVFLFRHCAADFPAAAQMRDEFVQLPQGVLWSVFFFAFIYLFSFTKKKKKGGETPPRHYSTA